MINHLTIDHLILNAKQSGKKSCVYHSWQPQSQMKEFKTQLEQQGCKVYYLNFGPGSDIQPSLQISW